MHTLTYTHKYKREHTYIHTLTHTHTTHNTQRSRLTCRSDPGSTSSPFYSDTQLLVCSLHPLPLPRPLPGPHLLLLCSG